MSELGQHAGTWVAWTIGSGAMAYVLWQMFVGGPRRRRKERG